MSGIIQLLLNLSISSCFHYTTGQQPEVVASLLLWRNKILEQLDGRIPLDQEVHTAHSV